MLLIDSTCQELRKVQGKVDGIFIMTNLKSQGRVYHIKPHSHQDEVEGSVHNHQRNMTRVLLWCKMVQGMIDMICVLWCRRVVQALKRDGGDNSV